MSFSDGAQPGQSAHRACAHLVYKTRIYSHFVVYLWLSEYQEARHAEPAGDELWRVRKALSVLSCQMGLYGSRDRPHLRPRGRPVLPRRRGGADLKNSASVPALCDACRRPSDRIHLPLAPSGRNFNEHCHRRGARGRHHIRRPHPVDLHRHHPHASDRRQRRARGSGATDRRRHRQQHRAPSAPGPR